MQLTITSVDYAPEELDEQIPIVAELLRELPGDDRPNYWLARTTRVRYDGYQSRASAALRI